jgi:hypothetical protein
MLTEKTDHKPQKIDLSSFIKKTNFEIKYLKIYLESSTKSFGFREGALEEKMMMDIEEAPDNESFIFDLYEKEIGKLSSYFYHSSIVLIYTFLENTLYNICLIIQLETGSPLSYKNLAGNNIIKKSKDYLQIVAGIQFEQVNKPWDRITQFQKLRNDIVHQNSTISGNDESTKRQNETKLRRMFSKIEFDGDDFFLKDSSVPLEFIDLIDKFLQFIYEKVESTSFLVKIDERNKDFDSDIPF